MKSRKTLKRLAIVLFILLCGFFYTFKAGGKQEPVINDVKDIEKELPEPAKAFITKPETAKTTPQTEAALSESVALETESEEKGPPAPAKDEPASEGFININTAGISELCTLTGIGEKKAERIISYRKEHGKFSSIEEIMNISGIKEGTFNKIKDRITV